jgi:hypothetical protein
MYPADHKDCKKKMYRNNKIVYTAICENKCAHTYRGLVGK